MQTQDSLQWWPILSAIFLAVFGICIIIIIITAVNLKRQLNSMKRLQATLTDANKAKDVCLNQFIILCSGYMDKLTSFNSLVNRKLGAGQAEELFKMTKSGRIVEEQTEHFYRLFDQAFLSIYPSFVDDINSLFLAENQISLADGEVLNTDLRILALMRLGLNDTNHVAHILNYSVNTIYAYRNRLRNRAINRDTFEYDLMHVGLN
ncbi:MAG: hypothetical protein K2I64_01560 [Muribaculaceae bacterium]|nr:hypothetical protein [Muribaculaceae bacterium]